MSRGESLGPCRVWVNPAQPPSVSRCAPRSRSPVSLIVLTCTCSRSCSRRWGPCPSPTPCLVCPYYVFIFGKPKSDFFQRKSLGNERPSAGGGEALHTAPRRPRMWLLGSRTLARAARGPTVRGRRSMWKGSGRSLLSTMVLENFKFILVIIAPIATAAVFMNDKAARRAHALSGRPTARAALPTRGRACACAGGVAGHVEAVRVVPGGGAAAAENERGGRGRKGRSGQEARRCGPITRRGGCQLEARQARWREGGGVRHLALAERLARSSWPGGRCLRGWAHCFLGASDRVPTGPQKRKEKRNGSG